jgi:hypothetical protein
MARGQPSLAMADETHEQTSEPPTGFPEPPGRDPGDRSHDSEPHHALNNPADHPDPTEWPDPYERREDPLAPGGVEQVGSEPHPQTGAESTSEPNPKQDPEAEPWAEGPKRDKLDE